jgi:hypothetical protein
MSFEDLSLPARAARRLRARGYDQADLEALRAQASDIDDDLLDLIVWHSPPGGFDITDETAIEYARLLLAKDAIHASILARLDP